MHNNGFVTGCQTVLIPISTSLFRAWIISGKSSFSTTLYHWEVGWVGNSGTDWGGGSSGDGCKQTVGGGSPWARLLTLHLVLHAAISASAASKYRWVLSFVSITLAISHNSLSEFRSLYLRAPNVSCCRRSRDCADIHVSFFSQSTSRVSRASIFSQ